MIDLRKEKNAVRAICRDMRAALSESVKYALDEKLCTTAASLACFRFAESVLMYCPVKGEPDILPLATEALRHGKRVAFPVCNTETLSMVFRYVESLSELRVGAFSIPEPPAENEVCTGGGNSVCIVPGFAFDRRGFRVGYGRGFYDRFLKGFRGTSAGLVYSSMLGIRDELPHGYFDLAVDVIVTEKEVITTNADRRKELCNRQ